jgi:CRP/FNR family transcriptional regulator, cyclic AMP receptor protein
MPPTQSEWQPRKAYVGLRAPAAAALRTYLLDADDELADQFDVRTRLSVRQGTTVRVLEADTGDCDMRSALAMVRDGYGLLILDGVVAYETRVGERVACELIGAGDLLQFGRERDEEMLARHDSWRILMAVRLGLLDGEFVERVRPWPQITQALLRRVGRRAGDIDALRAITCHPRLEVRLDLLFWHLAGRWGRVEPAGIRLPLPLTHRLLGELVAAERPSISHALSRLSHAGLVIGSTGDWHLVGTPQDHHEALSDHALRHDAATDSGSVTQLRRQN